MGWKEEGHLKGPHQASLWEVLRVTWNNTQAIWAVRLNGLQKLILFQD